MPTDPQYTEEIRYADLLEARRRYANGENISEFLRDTLNVNQNTSEIAEVAYDLQAGVYTDNYYQNPAPIDRYTAELAHILDRYIQPQSTLLDVGCGELTTISLVLKQLQHRPERLFAFDISWSRVFKGLLFAEKTLQAPDYSRIVPFVSDIAQIPLPDKSIDVVTSSYALYASRGRLQALLLELFRITQDKLVLFEPCYEVASDENKQRMDKLLYIKDVERDIEALGGRLLDRVLIQNNTNPRTPTACYVIAPPPAQMISRPKNGALAGFTIPGTNYPLIQTDGFYVSAETGYCFPILKSIPMLRAHLAILASAMGAP